MFSLNCLHIHIEFKNNNNLSIKIQKLTKIYSNSASKYIELFIIVVVFGFNILYLFCGRNQKQTEKML